MAKYKMINDKVVKLSTEEENALKKDNELYKKEIEKELKIEEEAKKNKESATTKLKDLGLTDDEITALIGS